VSDAFPLVFADLRALMVLAAPGMVVTDDTPTQFTTKTSWLEKRTKQPAWFGWIAIKKSYVAYHVMPLYTLPELNDAVPARLEKHRQGKTCFNFKRVEPDLFDDLRALTEMAARMEPELKAVLGA
jgi:hypothetical protein